VMYLPSIHYKTCQNRIMLVESLRFQDVQTGLCKAQNPNATAVEISIAQAASEQPQRISAIPATVTGAIANAATRARCARVIGHPRASSRSVGL
jgi:hypothetical protein